MINFDELVKTQNGLKPAINENPLMIQHPARVVILGESGSGKSNMLLQILTGDGGMYFDKLFLIAPTINSEDKYLFLQEFIRSLEKIKAKKLKGDDSKIGYFYESLEEAPNIDDLDPTKQNIIIFDDVITESAMKQKKIEELYVRGRKRNCTVFYLSHGWRETPPLIRKNLTDILIFPIKQKNQLRAISSNLATRVSFDEFMRILNEAAKSQYGFIYIALREKDLSKWIRLGFDNLYTGNGGY